MKNLAKITALLALLLSLAACGNDGGSNPDPGQLTACKLGASKINECKL